MIFSTDSCMDNLEDNIGYTFRNKKLLKDALFHSSLAKTGSEFERLEFLGDRVLGLVISEFLYRSFKSDQEGMLAKRLAAFVCSEACCSIGLSIGLNNFIETANNKVLRNNTTVIADTIEALIGAIFVDSSFDSAREVTIRLWTSLLNDTGRSIQEPKTMLQEIAQAKTGETPVYNIISKTGTEHEPVFSVELLVCDIKVIGYGKSKKLAETDAARKVLLALENIDAKI